MLYKASSWGLVQGLVLYQGHHNIYQSLRALQLACLTIKRGLAAPSVKGEAGLWLANRGQNSDELHE